MIQLTPNLRALLNIHFRNSAPAEYFILELSPSGAYVKLANLYGNHFWKLVSEVELVEVLPDRNDLPKALHPGTT